MIYGNKVRMWSILAVLSFNQQYVWSMEKSEDENITQVHSDVQTIGSNFMQLSFDPNKVTIEQIKEIEEFAKKFNLETKVKSPSICLLSLDGGGTRGYSTLLYLCYLTRLTNMSLYELLKDRGSIAVSSIGALIGAAFGTKRDSNVINTLPPIKFNIPEDEGLASILGILEQPAPPSDYYTPDDMLRVFQQDASKIFEGGGGYGVSGPAYADLNLNIVLKQYFGDMMLDQLAISTYITGHDMQNGQTVLYSSKLAQKDPNMNHSLVEVIRAAVAAPTYFAPHQIKGKTICDGGIDFNNPTMMGLCATALEHNVLPHEILCFSIGTGHLNMEKPHDTYAKMGSWGWKDQLLNRMFNGENLHFLTTTFYQSYLKQEDINNHYFRISPEISDDWFKTDCTKPEFFHAMEQITYREIYKLKREFAHFGSLLLMRNHDAESPIVLQIPLDSNQNSTNVNTTPKPENQELHANENEKKEEKKINDV